MQDDAENSAGFFPVVTLRAAVEVQLRPERTEHPSKESQRKKRQTDLGSLSSAGGVKFKKKKKEKKTPEGLAVKTG